MAVVIIARGHISSGLGSMKDVDDVVPLAVHSVEAVLPDPIFEPQAVSNWLESLSSPELRKAQIENPKIGIVWLEHSYEPTTRELQLTRPKTRALWLIRDHLKLQEGILYYS